MCEELEKLEDEVNRALHRLRYTEFCETDDTLDVAVDKMVQAAYGANKVLNRVQDIFDKTGITDVSTPVYVQAEKIVAALDAARKGTLALALERNPNTDPNTDQWQGHFVRMLRFAGVMDVQRNGLGPPWVQQHGIASGVSLNRQILFGFDPQDDGTFARWGVGLDYGEAKENAKATWTLSEAVNQVLKDIRAL